jgi:hypothetical protein
MDSNMMYAIIFGIICYVRTFSLENGVVSLATHSENSPFITSRKTICKDGVKLTDFVEDLW